MATHNGARTLRRVLDAYGKLDTPPGGWKLVIVNNGSTDDTTQILASFETRLPLTTVWEPTLGKSAALNSGLSQITGDLVVVTDDDAVPNRDWLVQLRQAADSHASFSIFGGAIVPLWEEKPPSWILPFYGFLSITDPSWEEGPIVAGHVYGPNMAVRSEIIAAGYRFDVSLGPAGSLYQMGEDCDFLQRIARAGFTGWHCKTAIVGHIIRKHQMNRRYMLLRARAHGRAMYRLEYFQYKQYLEPPPALLLGMPRYMVREILEQSFRFAKAKLVSDSDSAFREAWKLRYLVGRAMGGRGVYHTERQNRTEADSEMLRAAGSRAP
jgi:glycosyltransferase involved in cell wall biosynthesis